MGRRHTSPPSAATRSMRHASGVTAPLSAAALLASRALRLAAALALAAFAGRAVMGEAGLMVPFALTVVFALLGSALHGLSEHLAVRAEAKAAALALSWFERTLTTAPVKDIEAQDTGDLVGRIARQPGAAAVAAITVKNLRTNMVIMPLATAGLMAMFSWQAALLLLLGLPVMIGFFILIGGLTKTHADRQEAALSALSATFTERVRCLPTLLANQAVEQEGARVDAALRDYRGRTLSLLRTAFLNASVIDFFASLSVAMLAVFLGLGHLGLFAMEGFSGLPLTASLSLLILAPEMFAPLRRYAEVYHQAAEGKAALAALAPLSEAAPKPVTRLPAGGLKARGLRLSHVAVPADITLPQKGLVAVTGPSGCGKTSLLRVLAGIDAPAGGQVMAGGGAQAWCAADSWMPGGTLDDALTADDTAAAMAAARALGLLDDPRFRAGLQTEIAEGGADLSGGQRLRVSLARAIAGGTEVVFADEPTAKLDARTAERVRLALLSLAQDRLVIVATHDPGLVALARQEIRLRQKMGAAA